MTPDDKVIEELKRLCDTLIQSGLASAGVVSRSRMDLHIDWTADGLQLREAVLKSYQSVSKWQGENSLREFIRATVFIIEKG